VRIWNLTTLISYSSLMMEAARTSETSVDNYFTRKFIPEDNSELHTRRRENLKSHFATYILFFLRWGFLTPAQSPKWKATPVGCPRLLIQYIRRYPLYPETVSSMRNLRTRHAAVTGDPLNMGKIKKRS
jgi:hypothetical protein